MAPGLRVLLETATPPFWKGDSSASDRPNGRRRGSFPESSERTFLYFGFTRTVVFNTGASRQEISDGTD